MTATGRQPSQVSKLVLREAGLRAYELPGLPSEKEVEMIGEQWRPHRPLAAGYLFESMTLA